MLIPCERRLRIMHVIPSSASGGAPVNVARLMARSSMQHFVVTQRDDEANWNRLTDLAAAIYALPIRSLKWSTLWQLITLVRRHKIDVLHSHGPGAGLYARLAALTVNIPTVHTYRGFHNRFTGVKRVLFSGYERTFSLLTDRAIAVSPSERAKILAAGVIPARKLEVVYNPIDIPEASATRAPQLVPGRFNVVTLSRISPQKDLLTLLEVARLLGNGFAIHVIGGVNSSDVDYASRVRTRLAELRLDNMFLHGDIPGAACFLHQYDAYVSTALWEGLPTAVIEAFLARVAVVATDCTGNCDVVKDGETGLLRPAGDAIGIAESLRRLAADDNLRERMREGASQFARGEFDPERLVARMEMIYRDVVGACAES
jgi:glycosyltransferase involved in cell wall biosynthesis